MPFFLLSTSLRRMTGDEGQGRGIDIQFSGLRSWLFKDKAAILVHFFKRREENI